MAPVLNSNVFKCIMPIFENEMVSSLTSNVNHMIHKLSGTIFSSVYSTVEGAFKKGYLVDNTQCNWKNIEQSFKEYPNDFSILHQECNNGLDTPINNIFTDAENNPHILLQQAITYHQNGTANIFDQLYKVTNDYMFSQGNITETNGADFLGLNECTKEEAISALQNYSTYKKQLISIETLTNILQDTLNHLGISQDNAQEVAVKIFDVLNIPVKFTTDNLRVILDAFNVTLDDISPIEVGKNILNLLDKPFTEVTSPSNTENPNKDTNDGGYSWGYIAAIAVSTSAVGAILGYGIKYGWDWYKGRNIKDENLDLVTKNKDSEYIELLHKNFKDNSVILDKIVKIYDLQDIIKIARSNEQYKFSILPLTNLNNEIVKLNSPSAIAKNLDSSSGVLHEICKSLGGDDSFETISNFEMLITITRTANPKSEEYKESIIDIFEIFNPHYTDIDYQNHETPLLAAESSTPQA